MVEAGQRVGYGGAHVTSVPTKVAVLSVGYCDGLGRHLSSRGRVIVHDRFAPIIGNISMNLTTIDVTGIPSVEVGDEAILIGRGRNIEITAWEHAKLGSTIPYEVLCGISSRIPRTYFG
jgi:alanine racemase